jgi:IS5 family transposase
MVGARTFPGKPYDGHTLAGQLEQTTTLLEKIGAKPTTTVVGLGYRGVDDDVPTVNVIHRGKAKRLTTRQKTRLNGRQAVEPAIGRLKADHRMDRCWLKGSEGDALQAVLCAADFNIRGLLRAIAALAAKAAKALFFGPLLAVAVVADGAGRRLYGHQTSKGPREPDHSASCKACPGWPSMCVRRCWLNFAGSTS